MIVNHVVFTVDKNLHISDEIANVTQVGAHCGADSKRHKKTRDKYISRRLKINISEHKDSEQTSGLSSVQKP